MWNATGGTKGNILGTRSPFNPASEIRISLHHHQSPFPNLVLPSARMYLRTRLAAKTSVVGSVADSAVKRVRISCRTYWV